MTYRADESLTGTSSHKKHKGLLELERLEVTNERVVPLRDCLFRPDQLHKIRPTRSFDHRSTQTIGGVVVETPAAGCSLGHVRPRHVDRRHLQSVCVKTLLLRIFRSAAVRLFHLTNPTLDVRGRRTALALSEVVKYE